MDKLKVYLANAKKHHFWILSVLAVLIGLGVLFKASGKLLDDYKTQVNKIKGAQGKLPPLSTGPDHPNETWVEVVNGKTKGFREKVFYAWQQLYKQQKDNIFIWPDDLGPEFVDAFKVNPAGIGPTKLAPLCEKYQTYITRTKLPALAAIVDAEWNGHGERDTPAGQPMRGGRRGPAPRDGMPQQVNPADQHDYKVVWEDRDQQRLYEAYNWQDPPSELDVRYAQEEMWVMEAIFRAIQRANKAAPDEAFDPAVREINEVLIGYDATNQFPLGEGENRILHISRAPALLPGMSGGPPGGMPTGADGAAAGRAFVPVRPFRAKASAGDSNDASSPVGPRRDAGRGGPGMMPGGPSGFGAPADASAGPTDPDSWLKDGRYVDAKGKPLLGSDLQNSQTPEYNLMAFKIRLMVDEGRFQKVVGELANSVLPLEVRQVRINPEKEGAGAAEGPRGRDRGPRPVMNAGPAAQNGAVLHNAVLEVDGFAYIVNPPDPKKLGLPADAVPAAAPAAGAPAAAPATPADSATGSTPAAGTPAPATPTTGATSTTGAAPAAPAPTPGTGPVPATAPASTPAAPMATGGPASSDAAAGGAASAPVAKGAGGAAEPATPATPPAPAK